MNRPEPIDERMPRAWRFVLVAICTLILCSCRGPRASVLPPTAPPCPAPMTDDLPPQAFAGGMAFDPAGPMAYAPDAATAGMAPQPAPVGPWIPPGIAGPWPQDEYVVDGGDRGLPVRVGQDWTIHGLDTEDTIGHFDTLDGRTLVAPSNPVSIYAPRFGAVRKVDSLLQDERVQMASNVNVPTGLVRCEDITPPLAANQNLQLGRDTKVDPPVIYQAEQSVGRASSAVGTRSFHGAFKAFENLALIRYGQIDVTDSARLAEGITAAHVWAHDLAVQVILDKQTATETVSDEGIETFSVVQDPPGNPRLRVVKIASTQFAQPGDVIDFTIRFDNVGNQVIGNVTIIDNLSGRLEYVADSTQCSLDADFVTQPNEAGSQTLRWEIRAPLPRSQGGLIRFRCRVR
ncbi:MAG: DUF11 domain-containing protein [Pirellulales bacterium]|nr:DUF11 domain-containing protein [Pirellulales bacterium]